VVIDVSDLGVTGYDAADWQVEAAAHRFLGNVIV